MNKWEIKQIIDVVSKGVNSILMREGELKNLDVLREYAEGLTKIYTDILERLTREAEILEKKQLDAEIEASEEIVEDMSG